MARLRQYLWRRATILMWQLGRLIMEQLAVIEATAARLVAAGSDWSRGSRKLLLSEYFGGWIKQARRFGQPVSAFCLVRLKPRFS